jgi:hypothetical protein
MRCVTEVVPALLGAADDSWLPEPVSDAKVVVLLVLDGLGWNAVREHATLLPNLGAAATGSGAGSAGGPITTVAPSTTAAALTSITTGAAPSEHGLVGFRIRIDGGVLNALGWTTDRGRPPDPAIAQRRAPFLHRDVSVVTKGEFATTGFTEAHLRGGQFYGWRMVSELVERCRRLARGDQRLVYAYYSGIDDVAHRHGLHDGFYEAELGFVDRLVADVAAALPDSVALLVTADHGQVQVGPERWLPLGPFGELVTACSGDGRFRYLHARRGATSELLAAARAEHGAHAWVVSQEELIDARWLGPPPSAVIRRRLGDVVIAPFEPVAIVDPELPREANLVSAHGSLTPDEMIVPLVAIRGRA